MYRGEGASWIYNHYVKNGHVTEDAMMNVVIILCTIFEEFTVLNNFCIAFSVNFCKALEPDSLSNRFPGENF